MLSARKPPELSEVVALTPERFRSWWADSWGQGEHVIVLGQTGAGKSTLVMFLCSVRKYVIALDAKGHDRTLSSTGWPRYKKWPLPKSVRDQARDGEPVRVIIGGPANNDEEFKANAALLRKAIKGIWTSGKWTLWADEGQILADVRYIGAGEDLEKMLIAARDRKVSLVFCMQRPQIGRTTPAASAAISQSTWVFVSRTRDRRVHDRLAEICGRPAAEIRGLIKGLPRYAWACLSLDPYEPIRIVTPPPPKMAKPSKAEVAPGQETSDSPKPPSRMSVWLWGHPSQKAA